MAQQACTHLLLVVILTAPMTSRMTSTPTTEASDKFGDNCTLRSSCKLSPEVTSHHMNCACDHACAWYGDCCRDQDTSRKRFPISLTASFRSRMTCVDDPRLDRQFPVYILQNCASHFPDAVIQKKCESLTEAEPKHVADMFAYIPVTGLDSGILYRNSYCALCNSEKNFALWRVNISANDPALLDTIQKNISHSDWMVISKMKHKVEYSHPLYKARMCKFAIMQCAASWPKGDDDDVARACLEEPANFVYMLEVTYKNIHCAVCNFVNKDNHIWSCVDEHMLFRISSPVFRIPPSYSILFDFTAKSLTTEELKAGGRWTTRKETINVHCNEGQVFDPFSAECHQLYCQTGYVLNKTRCVSPEVVGAACPMITFVKGEFEYLQNKSVHIYTLKAAYPPAGKYWTDGGNIFICNPDWRNSGHNITHNITKWEHFFKANPVQGYITLALNAISIVGLAIQLGVYAFFPVLRNTPGKCLMCLSGSLLTSQLLFSVGVNQNQVAGLCEAIALLLHFGFLAYFFWMNTMAFDIFRAFSGARLYSHSEAGSSHRFLFYSLYAWLSPLGIVLVALLCDLVDASWVRPHYGATFCWFGGQGGLLIFFVLPVAVLTLINVVCFVLTVTQIYKVRETTKSLQKNTVEKQRFGLYVKLAVVMGLTWTLGFISILVHSTIVWYCFVVFNSLQGLWICLTFVCNVKVIRLIKGRYDKRRLSTSASLSSGDRRSRTRSTRVEAGNSPEAVGSISGACEKVTGASASDSLLPKQKVAPPQTPGLVETSV